MKKSTYKVWKEILGKDTAKKILIFLNYSNDKNTYEALKEKGNFLHPELIEDIGDMDFEGIIPAQVKDFLNKWDYRTLIEVFKEINIINSKGIYPFNGSYYDLFQEILRSNGDSRDRNYIYFKREIDNGKLNREVIGLDIEKIAEILDKSKIYDSRVTRLLQHNYNGQGILQILEKRRKLWKNKKGYIPKSDYMLFVYPDNFDPKILKIIKNEFGSKQIHSLNTTDQELIATTLAIFGWKNILESNSFRYYINKYNTETTAKLYLRTETKVDYNYPVNVLYKGGNALNMYDEIKAIQTLFKVKNRFIEDNNAKDIFITISRFYENIKSNIIPDPFLAQELIDFVNNNFTLKEIRVLLKGINNRVPALLELYKIYKSRSKILYIKTFKGKSGKYEYEMTEKNSIDGLIAGYATDCCQVLYNSGESCLRAGYSSPYSTFFVVKKEGKIFAQSWVWVDRKKEVIVFDSIELLGKDFNIYKDIKEAYFKAAQELYNAGYKKVVVGADGYKIPTGLSTLGKRVPQDKWQQIVPENKIIGTREPYSVEIEGKEVYTDTGYGVYKINKERK